MVWWWWILPALAAGLGGVLLLTSLASLFRGRIFGGLFGTVFGGALLAIGAMAALLGMNVQTYGRLTYERPVATVQIHQTAPQFFEATVIQPPIREGEPARSAVYPVHGDAWRIEAQVLKWKPWANVLGLDTQYRLDRLSGRYDSVDQELHGERSVYPLSGGDQPNALAWKISAWDMARRYRRYVDPVDTLYGGATYMPMAEGARYEVWITQSGLIARPANDEARAASAGGWAHVN